MDELPTALAHYCSRLWSIGAHSAHTIWDSLADHPQVRNILITALTAYTLYWFIDGVRHYQRQCLPCRGRGTFGSKLSKRLKRPCKCCSGTGIHLTVRKRLLQRLRRHNT